MKYIFLLTLVFITVSVSSQIVHVEDANTKSGIDYVYLYNNSGFVLTDDKGRADVTTLYEKDSVIQIQHLGYLPVSLSKLELRKLNNRILLVPSVVNVEEIVVAASRWKENLREVNKTVKLISKDQVSFQNPQTAADLLGATNNVFIQKSQLGGGSPMLRGFSTSRVLMVIDGVRMNNAIFREGNVQNVISLDPNAIQNAEVVLGPGASIYGSDALGGVMSFTTLEPNFSVHKPGFTSLNTFVRYGSSSNEITGHMDFNFGNDKIAATTSVSFSEFGDLIMGSNGPDEYLRKEYQVTERGIDSVVQNENQQKQVSTGYNQVNLMQKVAYKTSRYARFDLGLHYSTTSNVPRYDRLIQYSGDQLKYAEWNYGPQKWGMVNLSMLHTKPNKWYSKMKWNLAYQGFGESRISRKFGDSSLRTQKEEVAAWSANFDFEKIASVKTTWFYGFEGVYNLVGSSAFEQDIFTNAKMESGTRYPDGSKWGSAAVYGNYKHKFSKELIFDAGARYSYVYSHSDFDTTFYPFPYLESTNKNSALTGLLGLSFLPTGNTKLYANVSSGFRAPNVDDLGKVFDSEPGSVIVPNIDLTPEYVYTAEIGWVQKYAVNYSFELTGFYSYLVDAMIRAPYTFNGQDSVMYDGELSQVLALQNTTSAFIYGFQAAVNGDVNKHFSFRANVNYTFGEDSNKDPLRHVSPLFGQVSAIFKHGWFKADLNVNYNGEISSDRLAPSEQSKSHIYLSNDDGELYSPSWTTLNLKMSFKINHYLEALGGIENILDNRYRPYSSGIVASGRNFYVTLRAYL